MLRVGRAARQGRQGLQGLLAVLGGLFAGLLVACSEVPRREAPTALITAARPEGFGPAVRLLSTDGASFRDRAPRFFQGLRDAATDGSVDILSLSGGGSGGAFGAGVLVGLSRAGTRPQFELVTGVSAGALIAPFAFLGSSWDDRLQAAFDGAQRRRLLDSPTLNLLGLMLWPTGAGNRGTLFELVDGFVTPELIDAVAGASVGGRRLIVATTDLDKQETVLWDMGVIAAHGGPQARELFRDVLVASASVPGVFPPVLIPVRDGNRRYDELHVDGGVTTPVFIEPLIAGVQPTELPPLQGANLYMIINGALARAPSTTALNTLDVLAGSFEAGLTYRTREAVAITAGLARQLGMRLRMTEIPADYPVTSFVNFDAEPMHALFDFGARCSAEGQLWLSPEQSIEINMRPSAAPAASVPLCPAAAARQAH
jgi:hypothetical protein